MAENIFLIGFMGTGKTTVSKELSELVQLQEIDLDAEIEKREAMKIKDIFEKYGEEHFRKLEHEVIREFEEKSGYVVSCGGGAVLRQENVDSMKKNGVVVLLTAKPETIFQRVRYGENRPLLNGNMNVEYITNLLQARESYYQGAADVVIETDDKSPKKIAEEIMEKTKFSFAF